VSGQSGAHPGGGGGSSRHHTECARQAGEQAVPKPQSANTPRVDDRVPTLLTRRTAGTAPQRSVGEGVRVTRRSCEDPQLGRRSQSSFSHVKPPHATAWFGVFELASYTLSHATAWFTVNRRVVGSSPTRGAPFSQLTGHRCRVTRTQWNDRSHAKVMANW
jgi:hypothetical protein